MLTGGSTISYTLPTTDGFCGHATCQNQQSSDLYIAINLQLMLKKIPEMPHPFICILQIISVERDSSTVLPKRLNGITQELRFCKFRCSN